MKKKLIAFTLCLALLLCFSISAFADSSQFAEYILGWGGANALLKGHGINQSITVGTNNGAAGNDVWYVEEKNNAYVIYAPDGYYVNINRTLQNGTYYRCTGYYYENETQGRDQLVSLIHTGNYTLVRLANPIIAGNWYMMADYSQPVSQSDVIWYTDSSQLKARWTNI